MQRGRRVYRRARGDDVSSIGVSSKSIVAAAAGDELEQQAAESRLE